MIIELFCTDGGQHKRQRIGVFEKADESWMCSRTRPPYEDLPELDQLDKDISVDELRSRYGVRIIKGQRRAINVRHGVVECPDAWLIYCGDCRKNIRMKRGEFSSLLDRVASAGANEIDLHTLTRAFGIHRRGGRR